MKHQFDRKIWYKIETKTNIFNQLQNTEMDNKSKAQVIRDDDV